MDSTKLKIEAELAELEHSNHGGGEEEEEEEEKEAGGGSDRIDLSVAVAQWSLIVVIFAKDEKNYFFRFLLPCCLLVPKPW